MKIVRNIGFKNLGTNLNYQNEFHLDFGLESDIVPEKSWSPESMY